MIDNSQADHLIKNVLIGKASQKEVKTLEAWVKMSPENEHYFQEFINLWHLLNPAFNPDEIDLNKAEQRLFKSFKPKTSVANKLWIYWQRVAAVIVLPLILISVYYVLNHESEFNGELEYQELVVPYGMLSQVNLPDGSKVWLNGGSSLKYPIRFKKGERSVDLEGEGYFEVQSDKENPFIVNTVNSQLTATGTAFNINAYKVDSITAITLVDGEVKVKLGHSKSIAIKPGEHIDYNINTSKYSINRSEPYKWYAWKDGMMIFRDDPLSYVFKRLQLTFNVDIDVKDEELEDAQYRATFGGESLSEILRLLEMAAPIKFVYYTREKDANNMYEKQRIEVYRRQK